MKNYSNTNSCISREVPNLTKENTTTITTKRFSILNHKGGWKQIWRGMKKSELDIYINKNEVHNCPLIMIKQNKNQNLLTITSRFHRNLLRQLESHRNEGSDCESGFCVNNKCSYGQVDSECVDFNDCLSENCGTESGLCEPRLVTDLGFGEVSLESSNYDCTSVDDVVPTLVDWQGTTVYMPDGTSSNIVKIPSTITNINTFLAYTDHDSHCKMVLFQIARNPDTNTCSYKQLAAKYKLNTHCVREVVYCTFLEGECQTLAGDEDTQDGYGIEELTY